MTTSWLYKPWIGYATALLYLLSLLLPAAGWGNEPPGPGWGMLVIGWLGFLNGQFGWFANLGFLMSWALVRGRRPPNGALLVFVLILIVLPALQTFAWHEVQTDTGTFPAHVGPGYVLWLAALFIQAGWLIGRAAYAGMEDSPWA